ncbi:hypothetical protein EN866_33270 [Mesorhizobium sp. M2D.F.Ca.ET.223.01.1.1]|uniref:hypothetical protein n=1 Tax=Mesorhizobium sp. M2D.F.Ca.ET.223.01.1.1 TaxID=2563940 RepID=UPI0010918846|nr:hypothetical protein [Mesorhizobium sp. M2D.F.Ca.ET.223.01.1.1]TGR84536.1 hypothetical protein EN866_33270 [Mesorhizobium sp. M2D.F.Ca.ET.223.01.1.1]TGT65308.1 hypothetical protein EN802_32025 [bacterium M00.F.Ca.ET.159.01.1.1]TGT79419.1 hypothetical protein EN800_31365 [bacterium M00.F.Ca.ET.157.01.1.1]
MAEAAAAEKVAETTTTETTAENTTQSTTAATTEATTTSDAGKTAVEKAASGEAEKTEAKSPWGDNWREEMAGGDDDVAKAISRYGSPKGVARALREAQVAIRSGQQRLPKPDPKDEKAMAEWRKAEGIPDDPTGYKLPEAVQKRLVDEDKPILSSFTEFAHAKGARPDVVDIAAEWYIDMAEAAQAKQVEADKIASEEAEDALRKEWAHGEYKANTTIAKRWIEGVPGLGAKWAEARVDGKRLGDIPEFVAWAADMGREKFGDVAFTNSDSERKHTARKEEIEKIIGTDEYYEKGLDKEYAAILERELKRRK